MPLQVAMTASSSPGDVWPPKHLPPAPAPTPPSSSSSHHSLPPRPAVRITRNKSVTASTSSTWLTSGEEYANTIRGMAKLATSDGEASSPVVKAASHQYGKYGIIGEGVKKQDKPHHNDRSLTSSTVSRSTRDSALLPLSPVHTALTPPTFIAERSAPPTRNAAPILVAGKGMQTETAQDVGRYLMVCQVPRDVTAEELKKKFSEIALFKAIVIKHLKTRGVIIVTFYDPREARKLYQWLEVNSVQFSGRPKRVALQCMKIEKGIVEEMMLHERVAGDSWKAPASMVVIEVVSRQAVNGKNVKSLLNHFGSLMWFQELSGWKYLAEFYDPRQAQQAVEALDQIIVQNSSLSATLRSEDGPGPLTYNTPPRTLAASKSASSSHMTSMTSMSDDSSKPVVMFSTPAQPTQQDVFWTPATASSSALTSSYGTPVTPPSSGSPSQWSGAFDPFQVGSPGAKHRSLPPPVKITPGYTGSPGWASPYGSSQSLSRRLSHEGGFALDRSPAPWEVYDRKRVPEQNIVRKDRIMSGLDHRTTIMVKDVPNKLSRNELVAILNDTVPGGFDFAYLRFDFQNCCNVGYAFVNFTSVKSLYDFHVARVGKRWNMFSSDKVLQICYATIQGKQALINKFRNSAVMDVIEEWRPQIFYSSGTRQGLPEPFPEADNPAQRYKSTAARLSSLSNTGVPHPNGTSEQYSYDIGYAGYGTY